MKILYYFILAVMATWGISMAIAPPQTLDFWAVRRELILLSGVMAFGLMSLIMLMSVRPRWMEDWFNGLDKSYRVHKWAGILAVIFGFVHYLLEWGAKKLVGLGLLTKPAKGSGASVERFFEAFRGSAKDLGEWGVWAFGILLVVTLWQRFPYHFWRYTHKLMPVLYLLIAFHAVVLAPDSYWTQPMGWVVGACALTGSFCAVLSLAGLIGFRVRHQGQVVAVKHLDDTLLEITCKLRGGWTHKAGQFGFLRLNTVEGAHPFTFCSADSGNNEVRFGIKALGDYTKRLQHGIKVGSPVTVEGPYGRFDYRLLDIRKHIWIGAGIGITPFVAWLEDQVLRPNPQLQANLYYCVRNAQEGVFARKLWALVQKVPQVKLYLYYSDEKGHLDVNCLDLSPGSDGNSPAIWFCGPTRFGDSLETQLLAEGLPASLFHREAFQMR